MERSPPPPQELRQIPQKKRVGSEIQFQVKIFLILMSCFKITHLLSGSYCNLQPWIYLNRCVFILMNVPCIKRHECSVYRSNGPKTSPLIYRKALSHVRWAKTSAIPNVNCNQFALKAKRWPHIVLIRVSAWVSVVVWSRDWPETVTTPTTCPPVTLAWLSGEATAYQTTPIYTQLVLELLWLGESPCFSSVRSKVSPRDNALRPGYQVKDNLCKAWHHPAAAPPCILMLTCLFFPWKQFKASQQLWRNRNKVW